MACLSAGLCCPKNPTSAVKVVAKRLSGCTVMMPTYSSTPISPFDHNNGFGKLSISTIVFSTYFSSSPFVRTPHHASSKFRFSKQGRCTHFTVLPPLRHIHCQLLHLGPFHTRGNLTSEMTLPSNDRISSVNYAGKHKLWMLGGACSIGVCVLFSSSEASFAESSRECNAEINKSTINSSHGKKVHRDYSVTGIQGDGRCLFRSVAHGACIRSGKPIPDETLQRKLADELRNQVADEFMKRRSETEWFIQGNFDIYVSQMRKPHVWGGEPELLMACHVLQMPITVYMHDENSGGLIEIAEYGQEYGNDNPIRLLYHGFGHYDALQIPATENVRSRL